MSPRQAAGNGATIDATGETHLARHNWQDATGVPNSRSGQTTGDLDIRLFRASLFVATRIRERTVFSRLEIKRAAEGRKSVSLRFRGPEVVELGAGHSTRRAVVAGRLARENDHFSAKFTRSRKRKGTRNSSPRRLASFWASRNRIYHIPRFRERFRADWADFMFGTVVAFVAIHLKTGNTRRSATLRLTTSPVTAQGACHVPLRPS